MISTEKREIEEQLTEAYWKWRNSFDTPGYDIKEQSFRFLAILRQYQEELNNSGHEWV